MTSIFEFRPPRRARGWYLAGAAMLAAVSLVPGFAGVAAAAEEPSPVVATVNGSPITEADMDATAQDLEVALQQYPPNTHRAVVLDFLVNQKLMAAAATKEGLQDTPAFEKRMALVRERELRDAYFEKAVRDTVTDAEIEEAYGRVKAEAATKSEIHAAHILVETKEAAEAIVKELEGGADFAELAKEKSIGPSGKNGGDLGFFGETDMLPAFYAAAAALEPGKVSEPVQTEYGWHVIKVSEKRPASPPPLDAVRDQIVDFLVRQKFVALITDLKAGANIEITGQSPADEEPKAAEEPKADPKPEENKTQ